MYASGYAKISEIDVSKKPAKMTMTKSFLNRFLSSSVLLAP